MFTPALVVDDVVKVAGKVPSLDRHQETARLTFVHHECHRSQMFLSCNEEPGPTALVYPCSGAADVGGLADRAARRLDSEKGVDVVSRWNWRRVSGLLASAAAAPVLVAIDGCRSIARRRRSTRRLQQRPSPARDRPRFQEGKSPTDAASCAASRMPPRFSLEKDFAPASSHENHRPLPFRIIHICVPRTPRGRSASCSTTANPVPQGGTTTIWLISRGGAAFRAGR